MLVPMVNCSCDRCTKQMSLQRGINLRALAEKMGQCSGAEVRGICTEAGLYFSAFLVDVEY
jgi:ATP-dependent 26S proteasome regulatory subunit